MRREPLRPICFKIRRRPSGVPGSLPSTSILTPTVYVTPFVFQSTSMPVPSFSPHSLPGQRKKAGPGTRLRASERLLRSWGRRAPRPAAPSAQRLCPTVSCTSLWGRKCSVLAMPARKSPQGGDPSSSFLRLSPSVPDAVCTARAGYAAWPFGTGQPVRRRGERQDPDPWVLPRGPQNFAFINLRSHPPSPSRVR